MSGLYTFPSDNWALGAEVTIGSEIYREGVGNGIAYRTEQDWISLLDLMVQYRPSDKLKITLNAENVFDKEYFESVGSPGYFNLYGAPKSVYLPL